MPLGRALTAEFDPEPTLPLIKRSAARGWRTNPLAGERAARAWCREEGPRHELIAAIT